MKKAKYWLCSIYYDTADETELLIDISLSFGPVIEVLGPGHFRSMVKNRVKRQHELLYRTLCGVNIFYANRPPARTGQTACSKHKG